MSVLPSRRVCDNCGRERVDDEEGWQFLRWTGSPPVRTTEENIRVYTDVASTRDFCTWDCIEKYAMRRVDRRSVVS